MMVRPPLLVPAQQQDVPLTPVPSSGPSMFTIAILAAVGYGGYRLYRHFRKG